MASPEARPAAFLDRDGVLNVDHGYVGSPDRWEWVAEAPEAIRLLNEAGYLVFVVTNQSGIARGMYDEAAFERLMAWVRDDLARRGARIDAVYFCPHGPDDACACRKPLPGMLLRAMAEWPVRRGGSFLIGDSETDLQAAEAAGLPGHLFPGGSLKAFVRAAMGEETPL